MLMKMMMTLYMEYEVRGENEGSWIEMSDGWSFPLHSKAPRSSFHDGALSVLVTGRVL